MAQIIVSRKIGRRISFVFALVVCAAMIGLGARYLAHLPRATFVFGWLLLLVMVILSVYNGRKKIPFLPLGSSSAWLQFHVYAGYFTIVLFASHIHFRLPTGIFEWVLTTLYVAVTGSGIVGIFISRNFPGRLTTRSGEVIYERIPIVRRQLSERAKGLALKSIGEVNASTVADFYANELAPFFASPRHYFWHLFEVRSPLNRLLKKIEDLSRFLNAEERAVMNQIAELVREKDGLDYHRSLQLTLKLWLFVHIPLTYSLLILSFFHVVLVYAFSGGAR